MCNREDLCLKPRAQRTALASGVCLALLFGLGLSIGAGAANAQMGDRRAARPDGEIAFDIPAQALASALEVYSAAAGREAIYNGKLAIGRQSAEVRGVFTPEVALQRLLRGTGLSPRYMAPDAFVLTLNQQNVPLNPSASAASPAVTMRYYGDIQASLRRAFCANSSTQPGGYRVAVSFWIGPTGIVTRAELLGSTGNQDLDASIDHVMNTLSIGVAPPPAFAQPVTLVVTPQPSDVTGDCPLPRAQTRSVGVAP
jgi:TonB family protein